MNASDVAAGRPIQPDEAIKQIAYLRDLVEATRLRAADAYPFFLLWGFIWFLGYVITAWAQSDLAALPELGGRHVGMTWLGLTIGGWIATAIVSKRFLQANAASTLGKRLFRMNAVLLAALFIVWWVGPPTTDSGLNAYWPFWAGVVYLANSFFLGSGLSLIGGWLIAASVASLFMPAYVGGLWLAVAGGGSLAVTGFLFRRQVRA